MSNCVGLRDAPFIDMSYITGLSSVQIKSVHRKRYKLRAAAFESGASWRRLSDCSIQVGL